MSINIKAILQPTRNFRVGLCAQIVTLCTQVLETLVKLVVVLLPGGLAGLARRATARLARRRPESERPLEEAR